MMTSSNFQYSGLELEIMSIATNYREYWLSRIPNLPRGARVLEVGAGIGSNVQDLLERFDNISLIEPDVSQFSQLQKKFGAHLLEKSVQIYSGYHQIPRSEKFDLILYIDVLEHIEDDFAEIRIASRSLVENGHLFVMVPAFQALFSNYDRKLSHYRRYSKQRLREVASENLEIKSLIFMDSIGLFGVVINRILQNENLNRASVLFWDRVLIPFSRFLDRSIVKHRFGKSLLLIASNN